MAAVKNILTTSFYNLEVNSAAQTFTLGVDITIYGNLTIAAGTTLDAGANYNIDIYGDWINSGGTFTPQQGTVRFLKPGGIIQICGDNSWYIFDCQIPAITIEFEQGKTQNMVNVPGAVFRVKGTFGNLITLTRILILPDRWLFTLNPLATLDMIYVNVDWSRATPYNVTTSANVIPTANCIGWLVTILVIASQTEDNDNNGKIDRIRVQAEANINYDFSDFTAHVDGYELDSPAYVGPDVALEPDEFWIMLKEKPYLDTDVTPQWWIDINTSLRDTATGIYLVILNDPVGGELPIDIAAPIIGYTLAVAGDNEIFVHFSEPLEKPSGGMIDANDFTYNTVNPTSINLITISGIGTEEVLLTLDSPITANEVFNQ